MMGRTVSWMVVGVVSGGVALASPAVAQTREQRPPATAQQTAALEQVLQLKESRYQIGQIERLLEGAVEHGATVIRDRLQAIMPADMLLTENARARGFRLEGYGVFFDVEVPNARGNTALELPDTRSKRPRASTTRCKHFARTFRLAPANDVNLRQALERIELQLTPAAGTVNVAAPATATPRTVNTQSASAAVQPPQVANDPILANPNEAYRAAIRTALVDAMLEHTRGLGIWLPTSGSRWPPAAATIVPGWHPPTPRVRPTCSASVAPTWRRFLPVRSRSKKPSSGWMSACSKIRGWCAPRSG